MKKHLLTLASLVFGFGQLMADTATFDAAALYQSLGAAETGVSVSLPYTWKASGSTVSVVINGTSGTQSIAANSITFRSGKSFTVTGTTGTVISKITVVATNATAAGRGSVDTGTYTTDGATGTWTPAEGTPTSEVTFTATANSFIVKTITVEYSAGEPMAENPKLKTVANAPYYYGGTEPFIKDVLTGDIYALNNNGKYEKWGVLANVNDLTATTTYEGKLVILNSDNCEYKYVDGAWKNIGSTQPVEIEDKNYQNMNNWTCRFGYGTTYDNIENDGNNNFFNPYKGEGGWEPYQVKVTGLTAGKTYKVSFNFTAADGWTSWNNGRFAALPVFVTNNWDFPQNDFYPTEAGGTVL